MTQGHGPFHNFFFIFFYSKNNNIQHVIKKQNKKEKGKNDRKTNYNKQNSCRGEESINLQKKQDIHIHKYVYIKSNKYIVKFTNFQSSYSFLIHRVSDTVNINTYFSQQNHKIVFLLVNLHL